MAVRPMKWHIFNENEQPLCWEDKCVEFESEEQARRFLKSYTDGMGTDFDEYCQAFGVKFQNCIFYYDGGHLDCSNKIIAFEEDDWEGHLEDVE